MSVDPAYGPIEAELTRLVTTCQDFEQVRWLVWIGDCFDGGDFDDNEYSNLRYRLAVARDVGLGVDARLVGLCETCINGERSRTRNERQEPYPPLRATLAAMYGSATFRENKPMPDSSQRRVDGLTRAQHHFMRRHERRIAWVDESIGRLRECWWLLRLRLRVRREPRDG